ncbi:Class I SAM-dependent methyltransferase [Planctomycetales bacterium 10988]|nr:Class I SAM-dependent methyltransferase [Planctomycetales bacterium 10988]
MKNADSLRLQKPLSSPDYSGSLLPQLESWPSLWQSLTEKYQQGASRRELFADCVAESIRAFPEPPTVLDIGCGLGFDGSRKIQEELAKISGKYWGLEPDPEIAAPEYFDTWHPYLLEEAPLEKNSVQVAFSVFVLEHVEDANRFWQKIYDTLSPGGVFWGFTVDARHYFRRASQMLESCGFKDWYLTRLKGKRGEDRYANYPTWYRANSPQQLARDASMFSQLDWGSLHRVGQLDFYFPKKLRFASHLLDRVTLATGRPGSIFVVRLQK